MDRISKEAYYLNIAAAVSLRSPCLKKHYGAIIVKDDQVLASGYNGPVRGEPHCLKCTKISLDKDMAEYEKCPSCHAEMNSLLNVARQDAVGSTLYLYGFDVKENKDVEDARPCEICLRLIKNSGIERVVNSTGIIYLRDEFGVLKPYKPEEKPSKWSLFRRKKND